MRSPRVCCVLSVGKEAMRNSKNIWPDVVSLEYDMELIILIFCRIFRVDQ